MSLLSVNNDVVGLQAKLHPLTMLMYNGSVIVQGFFIVSSFLLAYNLLLLAEKNPDKNISLRMLPQCLLHRICRYLKKRNFTESDATTHDYFVHKIRIH